MIERATSPGMAARRAFSLVEAVASIVVLAIIALVGSRILLGAANAYSGSAVRSELVSDLSLTMSRIVNELREVGIKSGSSPSAPDISSLTSTSLSWTTAGGETRSISMSSTDLMLTVNGGTSQTLAKDVSSLQIAAYNESNTALASSLSGTAAESIRRVQITLTGTRQGVSQTLRTKVFVRSCVSGAS